MELAQTYAWSWILSLTQKHALVIVTHWYNSLSHSLYFEQTHTQTRTLQRHTYIIYKQTIWNGVETKEYFQSGFRVWNCDSSTGDNFSKSDNCTGSIIIMFAGGEVTLHLGTLPLLMDAHFALLCQLLTALLKGWLSLVDVTRTEIGI